MTLPPQWIYEWPMITLKDLSTNQLQQIIALKEQIEALQAEIESITGTPENSPDTVRGPRKWRMSAEARAKIAAAQRTRWAKVKGTKVAKKKDGRSSPAFRAQMAAAARARWKKAKAAGKTTL